MPGTHLSAFVSLVGAGPGDPELLTLRGLQALQRADVVLYDALVNPKLLDHCAHAQLISVGKRGFQASATQEDINALIVRHALQGGGQRVVRLKGGDPFVFGRGAEELLACHAARIPSEVIPGISSANAGPTYAGIPVTHRGVARSYAVLTGTDQHGQAAYANLRGVDTLVFLMALHNLRQICADLIVAGRPASTPVATVQSATLPDQRVVTGTLSSIADLVQQAGIQAPALTIVGEVVNLRAQLEWFTPSVAPLTGLRTVVTRTRPTPSLFADTLRAHGATVTELPLAKYGPPSSPRTVLGALSGFCGWLLLTSEQAVDWLFQTLRQADLDARILARAKLAVVGTGTREALWAHSLRADFTPTRSGAAHLGAQLPAQAGETILHLTTQEPEVALTDALSVRGLEYHHIEAYRCQPRTLEAAEQQALAAADIVTLPSASAARLFAQVAGTAWPVAVIGPQTAQAAREAGLTPVLQAAEPTLSGMLTSLLDWQSRTGDSGCFQASFPLDSACSGIEVLRGNQPTG